MRIVLAPMEGVIDHTMRSLLTALGGVDRCVTEFIRVTDQRLPRRVFHRLCPELAHGSRTPSGVPVFVQLLGGKPGPMAENAARAAELGAAGIDLNFGCPAKLVNRNDGGAALLREPDRIQAIIAAVRAAVPQPVPVTAKVRLGFDTDALFAEVAHAVVAGGANELTVHARTRADGYRPPAYWHRIGEIRRQLPIPVIANGEIWSPADSRAAQAASHCPDIMIGRGALARPDLARRIRADYLSASLSASVLPTSSSLATSLADGSLSSRSPSDSSEAASAGPGRDTGRALGGALAWDAVVALLLARLDISTAELPPRHAPNPMKQWLHYLQQGYPEAVNLFERIKRETASADCRRILLAETDAHAAA